MKIEIIAVGKLKTSYYKEAVEDYVGRIQHYTPLTLTEIPDEEIRKGSDPVRLLQREADQLLRKIASQDFVIVWDERGKSISSEELATLIETIQNQGVSKINMLIGGALGLHESVRKRANKVLSLSQMTFPHQLARLIILEQLYRAFTILRGEPYHTVLR